MMPDTLSDARLPQRYEAAKNAIAECVRVDECQDWANKAIALASYARQSKDNSLIAMAMRIQARAQRRCGELLKEIPEASMENLQQYRSEAGRTSATRTEIAAGAGLSRHQHITAMRLANLPQDQFNAAIEGEFPQSVRDMTRGGKQPWDRSRVGKLTPEGCEVLAVFVRFCEKEDPVRLAKTITESKMVRELVATADEWLDRFVTSLA